MVIHALVIATTLGKLAVTLALPTTKCEFRCKVRASVCLSVDRSNCKLVDILPDETTGLCMFQSMQVAQDWINKQHKYGQIDWTLHGAECVAPDDNQI